MQIKTNVKAVGPLFQHNQGVRVRSQVKVGGPVLQHNESAAAAR